MSTGEKLDTRVYASAYTPLHGLPPLAGLGSFQEAVQPGLSVEQTVTRLKRIHYLLRRVHHIFIARLTSEPVYELKMAFSYHAYLAAEQVTAIRTRIGEMREPPLGLERVPHPALKQIGDEVLNAPTTGELLQGLYEVLLPLVARETKSLLEHAHVLADQPTRRICKFAGQDLEEMLSWGRAAVERLMATRDRARSAEWVALLTACAEASSSGETKLPEPRYSARPFVFNSVPQRDERFPDPYNMGVNAEAFLYDESMPAEAKVLMMFYKRLREIDVPEMMASILVETEGKPWAYYRDMTRQLWDEARHAMMGEVGFVSAGVDWPRTVMVNFTWSLGLNTQLKPLERHAVLYFIEQGLMPKSGKRHEWEVAVQAQCPLAATFQDFDWADEVLHARIGRDWYVSEMSSAAEAVDYGDRCWSKVLSNWDNWRREGLTEHRNWWPEAYLEYSRSHGVEPVSQALAFHTTYESTRADLKNITGSA